MTNTSSPNKGLHRFAVVLACCTLALIFVGGLVTSTSSGLSVPDWPLSYGRLMPPMIGGVFYEHGHRMVAATVGFLTVLFALFTAFSTESRWLKKAAWTALGLVVLQGVLGGLTVLFRLPKPISIGHACLAQTFFSLSVAIAMWTSPFWKQNAVRRTEPENVLPLHQLAAGLFIALYVQLILGAIVRHTGWGITLHISDAIIALVLGGWTFRRIFRDHEDNPLLKRFGVLALAAIFLQIALGVSTYLIITHDFPVIPIPFWATVVVTAHVMTGALVLGLVLLLALCAYRTKPLNTPPLRTKMSDYFELTKPGISFMAGITALAGFVLGSHGQVQFIRLLETGLGILLVASGACTLNMVIEVDIDARMQRTKKRPLPAGRMNQGEALFLGIFLAAAGILYLGSVVNLLTGFISAITLSVYIYIYTPLKKISSLCTMAGAVAGALPPVMGWTAATGRLSIEAWVLFGILFFWQFPHFFSLAWLYKDDYAKAGLFMLPSGSSEGQPFSPGSTAVSMIVSSVLLLVLSVAPSFMNLTGPIYLTTAALLSLWLLGTSTLFAFDRSVKRARQIFFASILYVPILVVSMVLNKLSLF